MPLKFKTQAGVKRRSVLVGLGATTVVACAPKSTGPRKNYDADIFILGAGLAGLHAAHLLTKAGRDVVVLEANDRVGGRLFTLDHGAGFTEGGGELINATYKRVLNATSRLGLVATSNADASNKTGNWQDGQVVEDQEQKRTIFAQHFNPFSEATFSIDGGAQRLPEAMAKNLPRAPILKSYIKALEVSDTLVTATDHTGRIWRAPEMICTLPFGALRHLKINAPIPALQKAAIARLPYAQIVQVHFRAMSPFWTKDHLPADMWTDGPISQVTASRDADGVPTGLFRASIRGAGLASLYQDGGAGLYQRFRAELARLRPSTYAAIDILDVVDWTRDNHASGGAYMDWAPGQIAQWAATMGEPVGRLHFAGAHLGVSAMGMEAAMESAETVCARLIK